MGNPSKALRFGITHRNKVIIGNLDMRLIAKSETRKGASICSNLVWFYSTNNTNPMEGALRALSTLLRGPVIVPCICAQLVLALTLNWTYEDITSEKWRGNLPNKRKIESINASLGNQWKWELIKYLLGSNYHWGLTPLLCLRRELKS